MDIEAQIEQALSLANGKRKVRTLDLEDIRELVIETVRDGKARVGGGFVANSYGYASCQTVAEGVALTKDSDPTKTQFTEQSYQMLIDIGVNNASKGSALRPNPKWENQTTHLILTEAEIQSLT